MIRSADGIFPSADRDAVEPLFMKKLTSFLPNLQQRQVIPGLINIYEKVFVIYTAG